MHLKKALAGLLAVTILSISAGTAIAADNADYKVINYTGSNIMPVSSPVSSEEQKPCYNSFTGTVKEINDYKAVEGSRIAYVVSKNGGEANIIISSDTYILNDEKIDVGSVITGYYDANKPMIMIYPPQYVAEVVVVEGGSQNVKFDMFNDDLVSSDNMLKLKISDDTKIVLQDGKAFDGELKNRRLVVTYGVSTKSIPAQAAPDKVVVLYEKAVPVTGNSPTDVNTDVMGDVSGMDIIVENKKINAPSAYKNEKGAVMVPLRAIAESLGFEVVWDEAAQSVRIGKGINLTIGKDYYTYMKTAPIQLGTAPELVNGRTFVPLKFFSEVAKVNNAYVFEAQIVVDNGEKMQ